MKDETYNKLRPHFETLRLLQWDIDSVREVEQDEIAKNRLRIVEDLLWQASCCLERILDSL